MNNLLFCKLSKDQLQNIRVSHVSGLTSAASEMFIPYNQVEIAVPQFAQYINELYILCQNEIDIYEDFCHNRQVTSTCSFPTQVMIPHEFFEPPFPDIDEPPSPAPDPEESYRVHSNP